MNLVSIPPEELIRPPDKSAYWKTIFFISHPKHVVGTQKNRLNETVLLGTQNMFKLMDKKILH